jgi:signal transduction histidine kinase
MAGDGATVLIVEDSVVNRRTLSRGVENEGHRVLEAVDGAQALDVLAHEPVDMVLLDLLMPEVDGFEVLAAMKRHPELKDIPVLVISALEATDDVARAIEMGAIDCLSKPVDLVLLRVRLRTALEGVRLRRLERTYLQQELALRQQERLATLGRLSAGLGHELNNPAGAALSAARQLEGLLAEADGIRERLLENDDAPRLVAAVDAHLTTTRRNAPTARQRAELADRLTDVLMDFGVADAWTHAEMFADEGVEPDDLTALLAAMGGGVDVGLAVYDNRLRIARTVSNITASLQRIADLTAALRGYSYLDRAPQQDLDVRTGIVDTARILAHKVPADVEVIQDHAEALPLIHGYGSQLNQVWTNLLDNAIHAVGDRGRIVLRSYPDPDGDGVVVEVEDDGEGIDPALLGQVFDPFVTTKAPGEGTGLGLSIVHQIVSEGHAGRIAVDSVPGRTVVRVRLPVVAPVTPPTPTPTADAGQEED